MKKIVLILYVLFSVMMIHAQEGSDLLLPVPDKEGGQPFMKTLSIRASAREFESELIDLQHISNLLWAANGINRPDLEKRTAPSALNAQDIDLYVLMNANVYRYDAIKNILAFIASGDFRKAVAGSQEIFAEVPLMIVLVSDISRFRLGEESARMNWAAIDAGIVSQNISLYCASASLGTVPRATMDIPELRKVLKLSDTQFPVLNHPVGYKKSLTSEKN